MQTLNVLPPPFFFFFWDLLSAFTSYVKVITLDVYYRNDYKLVISPPHPHFSTSSLPSTVCKLSAVLVCVFLAVVSLIVHSSSRFMARCKSVKM